ncbi:MULTISPECIES: glycosyltransferase [Bombella]|uniref:Glycosyltransferase n=1 Tax=Bombella pollinis TaxID=2967337 RepID=A0ABT3WP22_9PROT|nr:glycosyltransferase [Bombella pollinis]MCT6836878.1 glycosyltransferase [Bifidobacteriales bacterium]MCX5620418.1 glycosyltransferase [Bombella pollinis]MUG03953.1 glycosyltransferase [Bombella sp. ESL0378]MUG90957.1 glycosyltransferase [Bombella sp. ESL0385]
MRFLFVHQSFPAQYAHIVARLGRNPEHDVVFLTAGKGPDIPGVRRVLYRLPELERGKSHPFVGEFDYAIRRAEAVAAVARSLKTLGFQPDIIIGHHGWGELLNLESVFPDVPLLGYFEFYYGLTGRDTGFDPEFPPPENVELLIRCKNTVNLQALAGPGLGQTPTRFQRDTYPQWAHDKLTLLDEGVDLTRYRPDPMIKREPFQLGEIVVAPYETLVTYAARNLEPYRGFHSMMRALPALLKARPDCRVILMGGDDVSYGVPPVGGGTWREQMLKELEGQLDLSRIHFVGWLEREQMIRVLQRSDAHIYLTYPFVLSWSLREAMALGCPLVVSDTAPVQEYLTHGETALMVPFLKPHALSEAILNLLEHRTLGAQLSHNVRQRAEKTLDMQQYLAQYEALISKMTGREAI